MPDSGGPAWQMFRKNPAENGYFVFTGVLNFGPK